MKLFDEKQAEIIKLKRKRRLIAYFLGLTATVTACVLFVVFFAQTGRIAAQTTVTVLSAFYGCFSVYFWQLYYAESGLLKLYERAKEDGDRTEGTLKKIDVLTVTVKNIKFITLTVQTENGERCLYVPEGFPLPKQQTGEKFSCMSVNNVVTQYGETP